MKRGVTLFLIVLVALCLIAGSVGAQSVPKNNVLKVQEGNSILQKLFAPILKLLGLTKEPELKITSVTTDKEEYDPGETATIDATFTTKPLKVTASLVDKKGTVLEEKGMELQPDGAWQTTLIVPKSTEGIELHVDAHTATTHVVRTIDVQLTKREESTPEEATQQPKQPEAEQPPQPDEGTQPEQPQPEGDTTAPEGTTAPEDEEGTFGEDTAKEDAAAFGGKGRDFIPDLASREQGSEYAPPTPENEPETTKPEDADPVQQCVNNAFDQCRTPKCDEVRTCLDQLTGLQQTEIQACYNIYQPLKKAVEDCIAYGNSLLTNPNTEPTRPRVTTESTTGGCLVDTDCGSKLFKCDNGKCIQHFKCKNNADCKVCNKDKSCIQLICEHTKCVKTVTKTSPGSSTGSPTAFKIISDFGAYVNNQRVTDQIRIPDGRKVAVTLKWEIKGNAAENSIEIVGTDGTRTNVDDKSQLGVQISNPVTYTLYARKRSDRNVVDKKSVAIKIVGKTSPQQPEEKEKRAAPNKASGGIKTLKKNIKLSTKESATPFKDQNLAANLNLPSPAPSTKKRGSVTMARTVTTCIDKDKDGYGQGCRKGSDCDDNNINIHMNCAPKKVTVAVPKLPTKSRLPTKVTSGVVHHGI